MKVLPATHMVVLRHPGGACECPHAHWLYYISILVNRAVDLVNNLLVHCASSLLMDLAGQLVAVPVAVACERSNGTNMHSTVRPARHPHESKCSCHRQALLHTHCNMLTSLPATSSASHLQQFQLFHWPSAGLQPFQLLQLLQTSCKPQPATPAISLAPAILAAPAAANQLQPTSSNSSRLTHAAISADIAAKTYCKLLPAVPLTLAIAGVPAAAIHCKPSAIPAVPQAPTISAAPADTVRAQTLQDK
jgi:hypothetical protein